MAILLDFIKVNRLRLVDWFFRFDKDHSGDISREEFKTGLKETGLKLTQVRLINHQRIYPGGEVIWLD